MSDCNAKPTSVNPKHLTQNKNNPPSLIGYFFVSTVENASQKQLMWALHKGTIVASTLVLGISALFIFFLFGMNGGQCTNAGACSTRVTEGYRIYACIVIGLFSGILIGQSTEYFTSYEYPSVRSITAAGITGPATVIIQVRSNASPLLKVCSSSSSSLSSSSD